MTCFISVIIVSKNCAHLLSRTLDSILFQKYKNYEIVLIDGKSTDGTDDLIQSKYRSFIAHYVSEEDKGVYFGLNKGISLISNNGTYTLILGGGDTLCNPDVFSEIARISKKNYDVIYGDSLCEYLNVNRVAYLKAKPINDFYFGMPFSHQSCYVKTSIYKKLYFDTIFFIASDYHLLINLYASGFQFFYSNSALSKTLEGGLSQTKRIITIKESYRISTKIKKNIRISFFWLTLLFRACIVSLLESLMNKHIFYRLKIIYKRISR